MIGDRQRQRHKASHVVVAYKDEEEERDVQQHSSFLPNVSSSDPMAVSKLRSRPTKKNHSCCKRVVLCLAILAMCVGVFEVAFHGQEAESLRAAKSKISHLEEQLSEGLKHSVTRVISAITRPPPPESDIEKVKSKSVIVLKTGASVLFDRLPVQLLQAQSAIHPDVHMTGIQNYHGPTFLVYSDADTQVGPFTVHDALANVSSFVRNQSDFSSRYTQLHTLLASDDNIRGNGFNEGWNLDKWKFLYMWEDAYRRNPNADWYIGYEADTYVLWDSLFKYLATQDATKEQLFGCASILVRNQELFANGGCPYIMSGALMRATYGIGPHFASKFDKEVLVSCCGDAELSIALRKSATTPIKNLGDSGPRFQGERPRDILFEAGNWCQPIFSFHHLKSEDVQWISQIERDIRASKAKNETILYSDVFHHIATHKLSKALQRLSTLGNTTEKVELNPTQEDWEAFGSSDKGAEQGRKTQDAANCKKQCIGSKGCTTWFWIKVTEMDTDGDCYLLHDAIRIGKSYEGTGLRISGWISKRIASFKAHHYCKDAPAA